jgi:hypothetical protein
MLIAGSYVAVLSSVKGSLTYGDTGKLMYAWHVNNVPHPHWQGEVPGAGTPKHPSIKIFESPPIYEFAKLAGGTYPVSFNPVYWYEGVKPHFELKGQIRVFLSSIEYYFDLFFRQQGGLVAALLILYFLTRRGPSTNLQNVVRESGLAIVALLALGMYAVVHVQSRYIGAFVVLLWADLLAGIRLPASHEAHKLIAFVGAIMLSFLLINIAAFNLQGVRNLAGFGNADQIASSEKSVSRARAGDVADELHRLGIRSGDKIAVIGYGFDSFWARLARVQIVAEMFGWEADPFWLGDSSLQSKVVHAFAGTGAKAIIAERVPDYVSPNGWHRVRNSNYFIYVLASQSPPQVGSPVH